MAVIGIDQTVAQLRDELKAFEKKCAERAAACVQTLVDELMAGTPVWSGETVRNYSASVGTTASATKQAPIDNGDPGPTNAMALGAEPRRGPNEAAVRSEVAGVVSRDKLQNYAIGNGIDADKWDLVENGGAPGGPGQRVRYPGGVSKLATQRTIIKMGGDFK